MSRRRLQALVLAVGALVVPLLTVSAPSTQAQPAPVTSIAKGDTSDTHPFSDPIYLPVRRPMVMDCYKSNPDCGNVHQGHKEYQLSLVVPANTDGQYDKSAYAMGAGVVTRVDSGACGGTLTNFGNQVEISHGGGITSVIGHLASFADGLHVGDYVSAGQKIGVMGRSGARDCAGVNYIDFYVEKNGEQIDFQTLKACVSDPAPQTWPSDQYPEYADWNQVPVKKPFPAVATAADIPDTSCLPTGAPATPSKPSPPKLVNAGNGGVKATWSGQPAGTDGVLAELDVYRQSLGKWRTEKRSYLPADARNTSFSGVDEGLNVRVSLSFHGGGGWSLPSSSPSRVVGGPPEKPISRGVSTDVRGTKAYIRLSWKSGARHGYEPTGYVVEIRKGTGSWVAKKVSSKTFSYKWDGLKRATGYQVRVKANSGAGASGYLTKSVRTPKT